MFISKKELKDLHTDIEDLQRMVKFLQNEYASRIQIYKDVFSKMGVDIENAYCCDAYHTEEYEIIAARDGYKAFKKKEKSNATSKR